MYTRRIFVMRCTEWMQRAHTWPVVNQVYEQIISTPWPPSSFTLIIIIMAEVLMLCNWKPANPAKSFAGALHRSFCCCRRETCFRQFVENCICSLWKTHHHAARALAKRKDLSKDRFALAPAQVTIKPKMCWMVRALSAHAATFILFAYVPKWTRRVNAGGALFVCVEGS